MDRSLAILVQTLAVAAASTVIIVLLGLALAYGVTRAKIPGRRFVSVMVQLPRVAPPLLVPLGLLLLLGRDGILTEALGLEASIEGAHGIVASQVFAFLPHAYRILGQPVATIDPALEEAAESLGAAAVSTLRRITLALLWPGLASAALAVFVLCMTDFAGPFLVSGGYHVLSTEIYARVVDGHPALGATATMAVALFVPCLLAHALSIALTVGRVDDRLIEARPVSGRPPSAPVPR